MAATQLTASPVTVSARSLASLEGLRASSVKFSSFGALKPGTLRQSQYRSLVVKAASVVAPKYTSIKPLGDRVLVKIKEAEEKTLGGILLPSTAQSKPQGGEVVAVGEGRTIGKTKIDITVPLSFIEDENVQAMHDVVYAKYIMFKKFQGAMQIVAMAETVIYMNMDNSSQNYWLRLLIREWAQFCIFLYIGWTFRSQDMAPWFSVMPTLKPKENAIIPPVYSMEMDAKTFREFRSQEWNIGVPMPSSNYERQKDCVIFV